MMENASQPLSDGALMKIIFKLSIAVVALLLALSITATLLVAELVSDPWLAAQSASEQPTMQQTPNSVVRNQVKRNYYAAVSADVSETLQHSIQRSGKQVISHLIENRNSLF